MAEIAEINSKRYRSFLENIDWQALNSFEWEQLCVVLSSRESIEHYPFKLKELSATLNLFSYIPTGDNIALTFEEQQEFVTWVEDEYMFGEPFSSYLVYQQEFDREYQMAIDDGEYEHEDIYDSEVDDEKEAQNAILQRLRKRKEWTILRNKIVDELQKYFLKDEIHYSEGEQNSGSDKYTPDITVISQNRKLISIEVKQKYTLNSGNFASPYIARWAKEAYQSGFEYGILTDGNVSYITEKKDKGIFKSDGYRSPWEECIHYIAKLEGISDLKELKIGLGLLVAIVKSLSENPKFAEDIEIQEKIRSLCDLISDIRSTKKGISIVNGKYELSLDNEQRLFDILLGKATMLGNDPASNMYIVKFSSLRNLQVILNEKTQNMCSLVCMNDPNEVLYAFNYIKRQWKSEVDLGQWLNSTDDSNNAYILSGSKEGKENDLTMWRLYGDDTKGICIKYKVDLNAAFENGFYLAPVSYGQSPESHFELDVIYSLLSVNFHIQKWHQWRHFFKDYAYRVEEEIRLLYSPQKAVEHAAEVKWFTDDRTKIYAPMVIFNIGKSKDGGKINPQFPLAIEKVYLGANQSAKEVNVKQFEIRFKQTDIYTENTTGGIFENSNVTNYRIN